MEQIKYKKEQIKLDLELQKLALIRAGKMSASALNEELVSSRFDVASNLLLLPKFNENDIDTFFCLFERVADSRGWPDEDRTLMLQCVFTGKAQEAYSALSSDACKDYDTVKSSVLKAYELVPEAYRQRFRDWRKSGNKTHVEFARDLILHFKRWYSSSGVKTLDQLCDLIILEQLKQSVPENIATYINEHKVTCPREAAVLADEYVLTHRRIFGERYERNESQRAGSLSPKFAQHPNGTSNANVCNYCHQQGHWKKECPLLEGKRNNFRVKSVGLATTVHNPRVGETEVLAPLQMQGKAIDISEVESGYASFMSDGFVTLVGSDKKVQVRILRDSGALNTLVREAILPFSPDSDMGRCVPVRGIGLQSISVPEHKLFLSCDLVQREVEVGVRPELPVTGVDIILGNDLAGGRVWPDHAKPFRGNKINIAGKSFQVRGEDWFCPDKCGMMNFARRSSCYRCGRKKTTRAQMMQAGGTDSWKTLAGKSRGLFSVNDWKCKTCGNVNWARRSECNICNTRKYVKESYSNLFG